MAIWYRVSQECDPAKVFSGDGGMFTAARWNHLGRKVVYCSASIALCTLEWLSHNGLSVSGFHHYRYSIEVPKDFIKTFQVDDLPKEWSMTPATEISRDFAEEHLFLSETCIALALPSILVPEECNLVINPLHPTFAKVLKSAKLLGKYSAPVR
jgi:RES domain-containing protein